MNAIFILNKWKKLLNLVEWKFTIVPISKDQVMLPDDLPNEVRYFVGIEIDDENKSGIIYHDRPLTEEDILHELLHVRYPDYTEDEINELMYCLL